MKCLNCENEAKWKSIKFTSPLCSKCARVEVDNLLKTGEFDKSETSVKDFYDLIEEPVVVLGSTLKMGELVSLTKFEAMK